MRDLDRHRPDFDGEDSDCAERLRFEEFLCDLSTRLLNIPVTQIDGEIERGLSKLGEFFGADQAFVFQFGNLGRNKDKFFVTHGWFAQGIEPDRDKFELQFSKQFPWFTKKILDKKTFVINIPDDIPAEAVSELAYVRRLGLKKTLVVAMAVENSVVGVVALDAIRSRPTWSGKVISRARVIGEILANALARKNSQAQIQQLSAFERVISEISSRFVGLSSNEVDKGIEEGLRLLGECLGMDLGTVILFDRPQQVFRVTHEWVSDKLGMDLSPKFRGLDINETYPWLASQLGKKEILRIETLNDFPPEAAKEREACERYGIESVLWVPFSIGESTLGYVVLNSIKKETKWSDEFFHRLQLVGEVFGNALLRQDKDSKLEQAFQEIETLKNRLDAENVYLKEEIRQIQAPVQIENIVGQSRALQAVLKHVEDVACTDATVLLTGETGTGKEVLAQAIHTLSPRKTRSLVKVNCAALPSTLVESELFGREKGAYTGALSRQMGRFEVADGSTIFLDEISELPLELQAKLLRVLQEGHFERLGSPKTLKVDVRVIAATNRDLLSAIRAGRFREDLYYRLNVFPICVPALRKRQEDIPSLVWTFVREFEEKMGKTITHIPEKCFTAMKGYSWPGNIRELRNLVERAMIRAKDGRLVVDIPHEEASATTQEVKLQEIEKQHILTVLERTKRRVSGKNGAAELLGLKPTTLRSRMIKLGITPAPKH